MKISNIDFPSQEVETLFIENAHCPHCQSTQMEWQSGEYPDILLRCQQCHQEIGFYDAVEHLIPKEGSVECPECEDENVIEGVCFSCGFELDPKRDYEREKYLHHLMAKND